MMPAPNPYKTLTIGAPSNMPNCHPIEATVAIDPREKCVTITTAWEPSEEELAALNAGGKVWLTLYAQGLPPAMLSAGERPPEFLEPVDPKIYG